MVKNHFEKANLSTPLSKKAKHQKFLKIFSNRKKSIMNFPPSPNSGTGGCLYIIQFFGEVLLFKSVIICTK